MQQNSIIETLPVEEIHEDVFVFLNGAESANDVPHDSIDESVVVDPKEEGVSNFWRVSGRMLKFSVEKKAIVLCIFNDEQMVELASHLTGSAKIHYDALKRRFS
jgi:hypothetical protein